MAGFVGIVLISHLMPVPETDPKLATKLHRRWRGLGAVIFMVFYSLHFAGQSELEKTTVYLKDGVALAAPTSSFYADMTGTAEDAGTRGTGAASAFLLIHRPALGVLEVMWMPLMDSTAEAKKRALASLQAIAGAVMVVFLYNLLLWSGLSTWNATLFAAVLGCSTTAMVFTTLPQPQIFSMLGLTAMLAAMARGKRARWWEFSLAALYSVLCSHWNAVPVLILALVRGVRQWRQTPGYRLVPAVLGSICLLLVLAFGGMRLQGWIYPKSSQQTATAVMEASWEKIQQARARAADTPWLMRVQDVFFTSIVAPDAAMLDEKTAQERQTRRVVALADADWFALDFRHVIWAAWLLLLVIGLAGLPAAAEHAGVATGALLVLGWQVLFFGALENVGERLLHADAWAPAVVAIVGIGCGRALERFKTLQVPVAVLLLAFAIIQGTRGFQFVQQIAEQLKLAAAK